MTESNNNIEGLLSQIRSGKLGRDQVITKLYHDVKLRRNIEFVVLKYGGQPTDYDHIFNTTLMQFVKTVVSNRNMKISSSLHAYLCGVAKFSWLNYSKKNNKIYIQNIDDHYDIKHKNTPESLLIDQNKKVELDSILKILGKNCKEVLMYWAHGYNMKEIAGMMNYKSDKMARKKKHICFKELLKFIEDNPNIKNILR